MDCPRVANFIFEHLFLPPQLPEIDHEELGAGQLLKEVAAAACTFSRNVRTKKARFAWTHLARSIEQWIHIYNEGTPCCSTLTQFLERMQTHDVLMFHVKCQNATITATHRRTGVVFEYFEVSATNDAIMKSKDSLIRSFPSSAVLLPRDIFENKDFVKELATAIHQLSIEQLKMSMAQIKKAENELAEERQSPSPKFVGELLFGAYLRSYGKAGLRKSISKRIDDDVLSKGTGMPWRRSSLWLSIRVSLQLALVNFDWDGKDSPYNYKNFMLFLLATLSTGIMSTTPSPATLHILRVKLARRHAKLGDKTLSFVQDHVRRTLARIDAAIAVLWDQVVRRDNVTIPSVSMSQVHDQLALRKSREHLHMIWERSRKHFKYSISQDSPPVSTRIPLSASVLPTPGIFCKAGDVLTTLWVFEHWVEMNLGAWLKANTHSSSACFHLYSTMAAYYRLAITKYYRHPARTSYMWLTIFELWVAMDIVTTTLHSLLLEYPPEVPTNILESLVLDKKAALERLARVELHISLRCQKRNPMFPSLFSDPSQQCFAVNFYDQSDLMKNLRESIEDDARQARLDKQDEWLRKKKDFTQLMRDVASMECDEYTPNWVDSDGECWTGETRHDKKCRRCELEQHAKAMRIEKHEWPLPEDEVMCKAVVFELQTPGTLVFWRDATWFVVHTLGRNDKIGQECEQDVLSYSPLTKYARKKLRRITLGSSIKPMLKTHYFNGGLNIDDIFLRNGMAPRLKDTERRKVWTAEQNPRLSLRQYCDSQLPEGTPDHMVRQVNTTSHTHNSVLAMHSNLPPEMTPHQHVLFGSLRAGEKLQFINILAMVMSSEADINSTSTAILVSQAVSQVGKREPPHLSSCLRDSQLDLLNKTFCESLIFAIEARFYTIEANWKETTAAGVLLTISLKVLSLCPHASLHQRYLGFIRRIRQAALKWIRGLAEIHGNKRTTSAENGNINEVSRQLVNSSLLVRRTFDLEAEHQQSEFRHSSSIADYVEASLYLHGHKDLASSGDGSKRQNELLSDAYCARQWEHHLLLALQDDCTPISDAIKRFWPSASFTDSWQTVDDNDTSWIKNSTINKIVHYNLVSGSLLVSGRSLSRLPPSYTNDPLYRSIFTDLDLDIFASDEDDMEYMSCVRFQGH
ncbi:uncharacterized protein A1O9_12419 [Exophiala aquamarina CBS 119918]|uniref:DUF6606 domain-containing protein n=1 Tax=Exophiala aquamarina CBS 119918 TaxID=1182545 RepID=A0A072NVS6_9EURO|nr:uncharacterized protein A1O9_12419 [Exophiala aquamarina CBS 119918]KEF51502.1 hypothetical protein A1O9_12419 [Exophiala aquamarina CBS 119918]